MSESAPQNEKLTQSGENPVDILAQFALKTPTKESGDFDPFAPVEKKEEEKSIASAPTGDKLLDDVGTPEVPKATNGSAQPPSEDLL